MKNVTDTQEQMLTIRVIIQQKARDLPPARAYSAESIPTGSSKHALGKIAVPAKDNCKAGNYRSH